MKTLSPEILDRLPPQNLDAEKAVLGAVLLLPAVLDEIGSSLRPQDFYADANKKIYATMLALHDSGKRIDTGLLADALTQAGQWEAIGGAAYLAEVASSVPYAANAPYHARLVARSARLRTIIHTATEMLRDAYAADADPDELVERAESRLAEVPAGEHAGEPVPIRQAALEALDRLDQSQRRQQSAGLLTGLGNLDTDLGGLFPGELVILAARPGVGKTSLACQIAHHAAQTGRPVYFVSLEMSRVELATRIACSVSGVSSHRVRTCKMTSEEAALLSGAMNKVAQAALTIHDLPGLSVATIRRAARRMARKGLALIVVDYLQLVTPPDRRVQRYEQVGAMTAALKAIARELDVPVLVLCQLNREAEKQDRPSLAHLRESGSIEQDADVVMFLSRPKEGYCDDVDQWAAELIVAKNRNGETGAFRLDWQGDRTRFVPHDSW